MFPAKHNLCATVLAASAMFGSAMSARASDALTNPDFDDDILGWQVQPLNAAGSDIAWDPRDASAAPDSGSLRIEAGARAALALRADDCIAADEAGLPYIPLRSAHRLRVLLGEVRVQTHLHFGYAGAPGENGCIGPGWTLALPAHVVAAGATFERLDDGYRESLWAPRVQFSLLLQGMGDASFEILLDRIELAFGAEPIFRGGFEPN